MKKHLIISCFTLFTCLAFSQEWVRQHPFAGFAPLHAITFDENGNGWAVGQQSLILHTSNWGDIWSVQAGLPVGYTFEAVEIVPGTNSQVVLAGGPGLFITYDGGDHWEFMQLPLGLDAVFRIQAFDDKNWMAFGFSKGIKTSDGGASWEYIDMPGDRGNGTWFNDFNNGWTGSGPFNGYQLYKTTNGGLDWVLADDDIYPIITDISMIDNQTGFMSARDFMYKTTNGGATWTALHNDIQPGMNRMHVVNEDIIWSSLNNGFVFYTVNGGIDWNQVNPSIINGNQVFDVFATADGRAWVPGKYASVQYTADNAQTWEDQTPGAKNSLFDVAFSDHTGIAVGSEGAILYTTNNGAAWENIGFDPLQTYIAMCIYEGNDENHVYISTTSGTVLHSTLDNLQWEEIGNDLGDINALYAVSEQVLVAGTFDNIMRTSDGGMSWDPVAATSNLVGAFAFPNEQTGYAAIQDGRILKSVDGGLSWNVVLQRDPSYRFSGIHFHDEMLGWAVAEFKDSVFTTQDGGMSWETFLLPTNTFWQDIDFMDPDTGYISGGSSGSGTILRTTDGGLTWAYNFFESERLNRVYVRPGEEYVWVVGSGGNILHFSPCAMSPEITNLTGNPDPCEGQMAIYEVSSSGATIFTWSVPAGWTIVGNDNSAVIEVLVGSGNGEISIQAANTCGVNTNQLTLPVTSKEGGEVSISEVSGTLMTTLNGVTYQWLLDGEEISGAVNASFVPVVSGNYNLVVSFPNGCAAMSNTIFVMITGVHDLGQNHLGIFPNPASEFIFLKHEISEPVSSLLIYDSNGRMALRPDTSLFPFDISGLASGVYMLQVITKSDMYFGKFVRK